MSLEFLIKLLGHQIAVYNSLTGSASIFIAMHPKHNPNILPDNIPEWLFRHNTVIIPADHISDQQDTVLNLA